MSRGAQCIPLTQKTANRALVGIGAAEVARLRRLAHQPGHTDKLDLLLPRPADLARGILLVALDNRAHGHVGEQRLGLALAEGLVRGTHRRHNLGGIVAGIGVEGMLGQVAVELRLGDAHVLGEFPANHGAPELMDQAAWAGDVGTWAVPEFLGARRTVLRVGVGTVTGGRLTGQAGCYGQP